MFKLCFARMFLRALACLIIYLCAFRIARRLHACKHFLPLSPSFYIMHNLHYSCLCTFYTIPVCALFKGRKPLFPPLAAKDFRPPAHLIQIPLKSSVYMAFSAVFYSLHTPFGISRTRAFRNGTICVQSNCSLRKISSFSRHAIRVLSPAKLPYCTHNARIL